MSNKNKRQYKIKEIIFSKNIASQEDLVQELKGFGFETTQATLSRDLNEMGIVRIPMENGFRYHFAQNELNNTIRKIVGLEIKSVTSNETCIVVKTITGRAQGVAVYFDEIDESNIIGTVAGDDTIIIIPDTVKNINKIIEDVKQIMMGSRFDNKDEDDE